VRKDCYPSHPDSILLKMTRISVVVMASSLYVMEARNICSSNTILCIFSKEIDYCTTFLNVASSLYNVI
jgi:hypothetical protein